MKKILSLYKILYLQAYYFLKKIEINEDNDRYFSAIILLSILESFLIIGSIAFVFTFLIFDNKFSLLTFLFQDNVYILGLIAITLMISNYFIFIKSGHYIDIINNKYYKEQLQKQRLLFPFFFILCFLPLWLSILLNILSIAT